MNMKYYILFMGIVCCSITNAQVGINTKNSQGVFHIDTRGNNPVSGTPTAAQMTDDIVVEKHSTAGINMSIGGKVGTNSSAQLALLDPNKAILLNRVALTGLKDITTIPNPQTGTMVYNTATAGTYPDNIVPGYYYFNGLVWYKWQYGQIDSELSSCDLLSNCVSVDVPSLGNAVSPMQSALADFGTIKIKETGIYIFSLRLYGRATVNSSGSKAPPFTRSINYLYMMKNVSTKVAAMEINVPLHLGDVVAYTHTVSLQAVLNANDVITFRLGNYAGSYGWDLIANAGLRANKTSLIYWKI